MVLEIFFHPQQTWCLVDLHKYRKNFYKKTLSSSELIYSLLSSMLKCEMSTPPVTIEVVIPVWLSEPLPQHGTGLMLTVHIDALIGLIVLFYFVDQDFHHPTGIDT